MDLTRLSAGERPPTDINVFVEIPRGGPPVKYELNKDSGLLIVDRFLWTSMYYPGNYGFIPHTLAQDGDPCDALIVGTPPVVPGAVIRCRPIGALLMEDEHGPDEKILAVPIDTIHPATAAIRSYQDLASATREEVSHFFQHYKDLEPGKWVKIGGWMDAADAEDLIMQALQRATT